MTQALQRMRSISKDIKDSKRSRESSLHKTAIVDSKLRESESKLNSKVQSSREKTFNLPK